ncbi:MAG: hypothetical protein LBI17_03170 [Rickettsiales bacterium]|jgi:hypothetical protein|nr:hypothetical protein [Rickettsiales bacterium]
MELQEKNRIRDRLSKKAVILRHESKVDIDILESETIRKLNKIEQGYFIITD